MSRVGWRVDRLDAEREPGTGAVVVDGWLPGPAGVAIVSLLGGRAELGVDVADPDHLVSLKLEDPTAPDAERLARILLGPVATSRLRGVGAEPSEVWNRQTDAPEDRGTPWRGRGTAPGGLALVGRIGLTSAELTAEGLSDRALAVGLVDAGVLAHDLRADLAPHPEGLVLVRAGIERWSDLPADAFDDVDPGVIRSILGREGSWVKALYPTDSGGLTQQLEQLLRELRSRLGQERGRELGVVASRRPEAWQGKSALSAEISPALTERLAVSLAAEEPREGEPRRQDVPVHFSPALSAVEPRVIAAERAGHHLTVHVGGLPGGDGEVRNGRHSGGTWLRVFEASERTIALSMVPFTPEGRPWRTAIALIPPEVPTDRLLVDVTAEPSEPWRSPATRLTRAAAARGAAAAKASRTGAPEAPAQWFETAAAWAAAGDQRRTALAEEYAAQPPEAEPLFTDLL